MWATIFTSAISFLWAPHLLQPQHFYLLHHILFSHIISTYGTTSPSAITFLPMAPHLPQLLSCPGSPQLHEQASPWATRCPNNLKYLRYADWLSSLIHAEQAVSTVLLSPRTFLDFLWLVYFACVAHIKESSRTSLKIFHCLNQYCRWFQFKDIKDQWSKISGYYLLKVALSWIIFQNFSDKVQYLEVGRVGGGGRG